jgi:hypothetical protein
MPRILRRSALGGLLGLAAVLSPSPASAAELQPLVPSLVPRPFTAPVEDAVRPEAADRLAGLALRHRSSSTAADRPAARAAVSRYYAPDGTPVAVEVSDAYGNPPRSRVQSYVDFIGSRMHGPELRKLIIFIVTPQELQYQYCAPTALACYVPRYQVMVIPGEETPEGQASREFVVTHELGHHIANNRRNDPWRAVGYGPKRWASLEGVCRGVREKRYHPTDQGEHYLQNPGENWAEAYAVMHYRDMPWSYDPSLEPDEASLTIARRDVRRPWKPRGRVVRTGSVTRARPVKRLLVETPLDGRMFLELEGPRKAGFDLQVVVDGVQLKESSGAASRDELTYDVCGSRQVEVRVVRRRGAGAFKLFVRTP